MSQRKLENLVSSACLKKSILLLIFFVIRGFVRPWVCGSVGPSVTRFSKTANSIKFNKIQQNSRIFATVGRVTALFVFFFFLTDSLHVTVVNTVTVIAYLRSSVFGNLRLRLRVKVMLIFGLRTVFGNLISAYLWKLHFATFCRISDLVQWKERCDVQTPRHLENGLSSWSITCRDMAFRAIHDRLRTNDKNFTTC